MPIKPPPSILFAFEAWPLAAFFFCMHNACITNEAGAGQDILPRHRIMTIVVLGIPRTQGEERRERVAPIEMLPGVVHTLPTSLRSAGKSGPERDVGTEGNRIVTQMP